MVEKLKVEVEVTKEINEFGVAIKKLIESCVKNLEDGFQAGTDVPAIMISAYKEVLAAIDGIDKAADEIKESPVDATMGLLVPVSEGLELLLNRKKAKEVKGAKVGN